jgi:hypothetical protein
MKRFILLFLGILICQLAQAQVDLLSFKLTTSGHKKVIAYANQAGHLHYIFLNKSSLEVNWISEGKRKSVIVPLEKTYKKSKLIVSVANESNLQVYFYTPKTRTVSFLTLNKNTLGFDFQPLLVMQPNEQLLKLVKENDQVQVLSAFENNVLRVVTVNNAQIIASRDYEIPFEGFYKALSYRTKEIEQETYSKVGITQVSHEVANNLNTTINFEKLYLIHNVLYFTFDEATVTHLVTIHLGTQKCAYKKLNFKLEKIAKVTKGNSFLIKNRLLRITANDKQLNLCVVDLDSFSLVKNYNLYPEQDFDIKNAPIMRETNGKIDPDFLDPEDFFNSIMNGDIAIAANITESGNYELMLGNQQIVSVQRPSFNTGPGMMGGGFSMMGGWGMGGYPGYYPGWGYPVNTATYTLNTYFKSLMSPTDFSHVNGILSKNIIDKLNEFEDRAFGNNPPQIHTIYKFGNKIHYGYFSKWNNTFYVEEF